MSWLNDDKSENSWDSPKEKSIWEDDAENDFGNEPKSLKIKFKLNPKIAAISAAGLVGVIVLATLVGGNSGGEVAVSSSPTPTPVTTPTSTEVVDLYSPPKMQQSFIDNALASAVTIFCPGSSGSGWAIDLSDDLSSPRDNDYPTEIVTNQHVIEGCEDTFVTVVPMGGQVRYKAYVYSFDVENDLAIVITDQYFPPLPIVKPENKVRVGHWVMAVGSPGAGSGILDGSITTGAITNLRDSLIITDTTINPGNSGGPLLNSAGEVVAVVFAKIDQERVDNIGLAQDVNSLCIQLENCNLKRIIN